MAVYYYNGAKILAPFTILSNEPMFDMTTISLKTQRASQGHQRWEISFNTVFEKDNQVNNFLQAISDLEQASTMVMPQLMEVADNNSLTGTPEVTEDAASGSTTILIDSSAVDGFLPKGSFIKFTDHQKLYITLNDLDLNGVSTQSLNIYPGLVKTLDISLTNPKLVSGDGVVLTYYRSIDNQTGITFSDGILSNSGTITLIEAL